MALAAWGVGGLILAAPRAWANAMQRLAGLGSRVGPGRAYEAMLSSLNRVSDIVHRTEVRDLRNSLAAVFVPGGILTAMAFAVTPTRGAYAAGRVQGEDLLLIALLGLTAAAALAVAGTGEHLRAVLALSVVGFALASVYTLIGAPDVALVAVVVETIVALMFLGVLARLPRSDRPPAARSEGTPSRRWRDPAVGAIAGVAAFTAIWGFLSPPVLAPGIAPELIRLSPTAHGKSVVTVILADFRGLDTLAEITVLVIAAVGVATLLRRGRLW